MCSWLGNELAPILVWHPGSVHIQHLLGTIPAPLHGGSSYEAIRNTHLVSDGYDFGNSMPHHWNDAGGDNQDV